MINKQIMDAAVLLSKQENYGMPPPDYMVRLAHRCIVFGVIIAFRDIHKEEEE
jgi:hypothetical protein